MNGVRSCREWTISLQHLRFALLLSMTVLLMAGCGRRAAAPVAAPPATATPPPTSVTAAVTEVPGVTEVPEAPVEAVDATGPTGELQTVIPDNFRSYVDDARGYALALPPGWTEFDLRGEQFGTILERVGLGDLLAPATDFLATSAGQGVGLVAATDLTGAIFGGVPTLLNASVIDTRASDPTLVIGLINRWLSGNQRLLTGVTIDDLTETTVNGLPAIQLVARVDLSSMGINRALHVESVGLVANDKLYLLTLATDAGQREAKAEEFDQIIATFGPN